MSRRTCVVAVAVILASVAGFPIRGYALDTAAGIPADSRTTWIVGFATFDTVELPDEFAYLAASIPQLLLGDLQAVTTHSLSSRERQATARSVLDAAVADAGKKLSALVSQRDQLLFSTSDAVTIPTQYQAVDAQISVARRNLDFLQGLTESVVPIAAQKPIRFWSGHQEGKLLPSPAQRPAALAGSDSLDTIVFGTVTYQAGLAYLDIYGYDRALDLVDYHKSYAGRPEELYDWVNFAADELAGYLLGRDWANLTVQTAPVSAAIRFDGVLVGYGKASLKYVAPGDHVVSVAEAGYPSTDRTVKLQPSRSDSLTIPLGEPTGGTTRIDSIPDAADVYVGSLWAGRTPLSVPLPIQPEEVRISKKGYLDSDFLLSPAGPVSISRTLMSASIDWSKEIQARRDRFYTHLGWFLLAVPLPVILNGLYQNEAVAASSSTFSTLTPATQHQVIVSGNAYYYAAWGTAFLAGGLFINAIISLVDYIGAGQSYHVR